MCDYYVAVTLQIPKIICDANRQKLELRAIFREHDGASDGQCEPGELSPGIKRRYLPGSHLCGLMAMVINTQTDTVFIFPSFVAMLYFGVVGNF
jgi:hypothetical protein